MNRSRIDRLLIIVFVAIVILPQIIFWFVNNETIEVSTTENRKLNSKPKFEFATITSYPQNFDNYYNDHLPFRNELREIWTNLNYELFNTTVDNRVLIGKDGWLFYRGDQTIEQTRGVINYTDKEKEDILSKLQNNVDKLKENGIETYVLVLPNKENVYKEKLPNNISIEKDRTKAEKLIDYIKQNSDINIVYPKEELVEAKEKYQVYRKYDTHWNKVGACIGTICLQRAIDSNFSYSLEDITIEEIEEKDLNDLANFASLNEELFENIIRVSNFNTEVEYTKVEGSKYEEYVSNSKNDKTILFIGDSFRTDMVEYLSKLYKRVIFVHRDHYTKSSIEEISPNIVVIETVERYSDSISKQLL